MDKDKINKAAISKLIFNTIGWPIGRGKLMPCAEDLEIITDHAFKSRVGLLFLDECVRKDVKLGPKARELHASLISRRSETNRVVARLARRLDEVAKNEWVLFKSIKPFASTPNDTDWFPFERERHKELVDYLTSPSGGFKWMETAPLQTTLIEENGEGKTNTTKAGGAYYIDCYVAPSTDYFIYIDPRRMRDCIELHEVEGYPVPILKPHAELTAILFHNVFPEKSFTIESYYLVKRYLDLIEERNSIEDFIMMCHQQKIEYACAVNLCVTRDIDKEQFDISDPRISLVLKELGYSNLRIKGFDPLGAFPYEFPAHVFWRAFLSKQRDRTSFLSTLNQFLHMLNPIFFVDVVRIVWRRTVRGGVYEQN